MAVDTDARGVAMGTCLRCGKGAATVSATLGFCAACIRSHFEALWPAVRAVHRQSRRIFGLPETPPQTANGVACRLCFHGCRIGEAEAGFCGLRRCEAGRIRGGRPHEGRLSYYHDPLPTNCVATFVCPAGTGRGYPRFAAADGPEYGFRNLAVFYEACGFNCLYCQNYHFKQRRSAEAAVTARRLAAAVDATTRCICYFGGDPTPQVLHALKAARLALKNAGDRILRICWETNGSARPPLLERMASLSLTSGGCVKIDLKAWDERIHYALCGVSNGGVLANFRRLARLGRRRREPPLLVASTLLVPGYIDEAEVAAIAAFIAGLDPQIPYSLLAFYPCFFLRDLPTTSRAHAERCRKAARAVGLRRVHVGNSHLLGDDYA